ncbi:MAG: chorismate synthase [Clostridia bacterium]|nr:chorismate synthase [Clostridia bacterium]
MKNTFGTSVAVTIFGESHGAEIGVVVDGLAPGIPVDEEFVNRQLALRRPAGKISTARVEPDPWRMVSGVYNGFTTGTPLTILIPNTDTKSRDYSATRYLARPGHADYTAWEKYHGYEDFRGGGHFSGRITAGLVAAGAIALTALKGKGIRVGTHIARLGGIADRKFENLEQDIETLSNLPFAVLDPAAGEKMQEAILKAAADKDSVGGVLETCVTGIPAGVGEPWFDSVESLLSHGLFSIPGVKGVEFGDGFAMADLRGSEANDPFRVEDNKIVTATNHNGGINGGISNGMPLLIRMAVKPTPSIFREQDTVNFNTVENAALALAGRHDPAIVHRARVVADSVVALVLCDLLTARFGTDWLGKE